MISAILLAFAVQDGPSPATVDFNRDVLPILSESCFSCHGPDEGSRKAQLRLDTREGALADLGGYAAIAPGDPSESEVWLRITAELEEDRMPPPQSHRPALGPRELEVLRTWIENGAPWTRHWAFVAPIKAELSTPEAHPIDNFVQQRLLARGLQPAAPAQTHTLARRLAFDLTGLPPSSSALVNLGSSPSDKQWTQYVDELLFSPHYGERMAMWWLDGARYADSDGFQQDEVRTNWPWRDWVVSAFQTGMPFDEFITLQLAGDLLPDATQEQILATCFQRNHMHNGEGGRDPEESRVDYVRDRTNTLGTAMLGLTLECAQCHDHKFDPISQRDYYSLAAFFDSIDETGQAGSGAGPFLKVKSPFAQPHLDLAKRELAEALKLNAQMAKQRSSALQTWTAERQAEMLAGRQTWTRLHPSTLQTAEGSQLVLQDDSALFCQASEVPQEDYLLRFDQLDLERMTGLRLEVLPDLEQKEASEESANLSFAEDGEFIITGVKLRVMSTGGSQQREIELIHAVASPVGKGVDEQNGPASSLLDDDPRTGWTTRGKAITGTAEVVLELSSPLMLAEEEHLIISVLQRSTVPGAHPKRLRLSATDQRGPVLRKLGPAPLEELRDLPTDQPVSTELQAKLERQFLENDSEWRAAKRRSDRFRSQQTQAEQSAGELAVTVLRERAEPRTSYVLERGVWDKKGAEVQRSFPAEVFDLQLESLAEKQASATTHPLSRLDLAQWVTSRDNPLTARSIVNQVWQNLFGQGLVRTPSDFGLQGQRPEYPRVLDWLAVEFMENDWDVRQLLRLIVSSETYRQSSASSSQLQTLDPTNLWLARGPRFRLPSWMIRDAALATSGLLDPTIGGPPMYPYQPPGVWADVFNGRFKYEPTLGQARHRRTLYAFWRRNAAPTYLFDNADRRTCTVDVRRTNTPLQALTLLNDRTFLEAASALVNRELNRVNPSTTFNFEAAIIRMANAVLQRELDPEEHELLNQTFAIIRRQYQADEPSAVLLLSSTAGLNDSPSNTTQPGSPDQRAALLAIANMLFNLDEAVTHE